MADVYIVIGSTGEYSERLEWLVKAFRDETLAQRLVLNATARANELASWEGAEGLCSWAYAEDDPTRPVNEHDPLMKIRGGEVRYRYDIVELEE